MSIIRYYYKVYFYFCRLPRVTQYGITGIGIGIFALSWWLVCYMPIQASIISYNNKINYLNKQKQKSLALQAQNANQEKLSIDGNRSSGAQEVGLHHALAWLIDCAQLHSLLIDSCKVKETHDKNEDLRASFMISLRGLVTNFLPFFKCVEQSSYSISCLSSDIKRIDDNFVQCILELEFFIPT